MPRRKETTTQEILTFVHDVAENFSTRLAETRDYAAHLYQLTLPTQPKAPQEYVTDAWHAPAPKGVPPNASAPWCLPDRVPDGNVAKTWTVRVKWFWEPSLPAMMQQCHVFADFPLDADGGLDFSAVRRTWGLSPNCTIVRHKRGQGVKAFTPSSPQRLTAREVRVVTGHDNCISIFEEPSEAEMRIRDYREVWTRRHSAVHAARTVSQVTFWRTIVPTLFLLACIALAVGAWPVLGWAAYLALVVGEVLVVYAVRVGVMWARCVYLRGIKPGEDPMRVR